MFVNIMLYKITSEVHLVCRTKWLCVYSYFSTSARRLPEKRTHNLTFWTASLFQPWPTSRHKFILVSRKSTAVARSFPLPWIRVACVAKWSEERALKSISEWLLRVTSRVSHLWRAGQPPAAARRFVLISWLGLTRVTSPRTAFGLRSSAAQMQNATRASSGRFKAAKAQPRR